MSLHDFIFSQMFLKHALGTRIGPQIYEKLLIWSGIFWPWKYKHWNLKNMDLRNLSRNIYIFPAETCKNMGLFKVIVWLQMFRCPKVFFGIFGRGTFFLFFQSFWILFCCFCNHVFGFFLFLNCFSIFYKKMV